MHRARIIQQCGIGIGQHIGWKGQRQRQRDFDEPSASEIVQRDQPRRARAQHSRTGGDGNDEDQRGQRIAWQHRLRQGRPCLQIAQQRSNHSSDQRQYAKRSHDPAQSAYAFFAHATLIPDLRAQE